MWDGQDSLVDLCRDPSLLTALYNNYDCELGHSDIFEETVRFLANNAYPIHGQLTTQHQLSIDGVLSIVNAMSMRCSEPQPASDAAIEKAAKLRDQKVSRFFYSEYKGWDIK